MKKIFFIFLTVFFVLNATHLFAAGPMTGKVLEENPQIVILEADGPERFPVGSEIELSYTAGFMEMLIGRFKVAGVKGNRYTLEVVSLATRPSQGMKVNVVAAVDWQSQLLNSRSQPSPSGLPPVAPIENKSEGEVAEVLGEDVLIEVKEGPVPVLDDIAELKYVTGSGAELEVGTWKVTDIQGKQVKATPFQKMTQPRKGLKVTFKPKPASEPALFPGGSSTPDFGAPAAGFPAQSSSGKSSSDNAITLLGVSAPASSNNDTINLLGVSASPAPAGPPPGAVIDNNLFSPTYGQPITPEAQKQQDEYMRQMSIQQKKAALEQRQSQGVP